MYDLPVVVEMSLSRAAALPPAVRKECQDLASNVDRVRAFVNKFVSMGFCDVNSDPAHAKAGQSDCPFMCSDMISFLCRVEKLCPSRDAALYVTATLHSLAHYHPLIPLSGVPDSGKGGTAPTPNNTTTFLY